MRLGAVFPQAEFLHIDGEIAVAFVRKLEDAGYDHLLVFDHVLGADSSTRPGWAGAYDHRDPFLEPLTFFAYLASACNLEFVTDVLVLPQRQTALVAKQAATLELLAPGRLRLGVGIGWNTVEVRAGSRLCAGLPETPWLYFVHSYAPDPADEASVAAWCTYGRRFAAATETGPIWATQFHPEKSGATGLRLLQNLVAAA